MKTIVNVKWEKKGYSKFHIWVKPVLLSAWVCKWWLSIYLQIAWTNGFLQTIRFKLCFQIHFSLSFDSLFQENGV